MFFAGSRLPSQWIGGHVSSGGQAIAEGNPYDRAVFFGLIAISIGILIARSFRWGDFFARNFFLMAFIAFALVSVAWSDFPFISFKRWFRDLGNYLVVLVVLSDTRPMEAVRTLLRRLFYLLIPLSILLVKYFPDVGRSYDAWSGIALYSGVTTGKNILGIVCAVSAIFFFWDTVTRWADRKVPRTKRIIATNFVFIGMALWLLNLAKTTTANVCIAIGIVVIIAVYWRKRQRGLIRVLIPAIFCVYLIAAFGFDLNGRLAGELGKDPTLTDRTAIWNILLGMNTNHLIGTGYESFWLSYRDSPASATFPWLNEAHNGYLEVYLNLGLVGLGLLVGLLATGYVKLSRMLKPFSDIAALYLALWIVVMFYDITEAGFRGSIIWLIFLLMAVTVRAPSAERAPARSTFRASRSEGSKTRPALQPADQR
jgi:exopolysaccharide production protein ExoQ